MVAEKNWTGEAIHNTSKPKQEQPRLPISLRSRSSRSSFWRRVAWRSGMFHRVKKKNSSKITRNEARVSPENRVREPTYMGHPPRVVGNTPVRPKPYASALSSKSNFAFFSVGVVAFSPDICSARAMAMGECCISLATVQAALWAPNLSNALPLYLSVSVSFSAVWHQPYDLLCRRYRWATALL